MKVINKIGNETLLNREKSLFLCSKHAPYSIYDRVFGWVDSLTTDDCVICFNSSELEDEVMRALLVNQVPTILVVMNRFTDKFGKYGRTRFSCECSMKIWAFMPSRSDSLGHIFL